MTDEQEQTERRKRTPKDIVIFQVMDDSTLTMLPLDLGVPGTLSSTQEARKWIKANGDKLADKTLVIGSMSPEITIKVKQVSRVSFE